MTHIAQHLPVSSQTADTTLYDVTIIGGGPAGLFGLFYAGMRGLRRKLIDSLDQLGGQLMALYPEKPIYDMPGFPSVLARDLASGLIRQALAGEPTICLGQRVDQLLDNDDGTLTVTTDRAAHRTRTVLIAAGAGAFSPKRLGRPAVDIWEGRGLHYGTFELAPLANRDVVVVGGGDSAIDWALVLVGHARSVTLVHRRDEFRAHEDSLAKLRASSAVIMTPYEVRRLVGAADAPDAPVAAVVVNHVVTKAESTLPADAVLMHLGFSADLGPIKTWGLATRGADLAVDARMATSRPGVFACGDIASYDGKLKLIATGTAEAATAVNHIKAMLDPRAKVFPGHSSDRGPPTAVAG